MSRRKPGSLIGLEREILDVALSLRRAGDGQFHGFGLALRLRERSDARSLTGHGTLYKALGRLEELGLVRSSWEDPPAEGRPRRRLYELTVAGAYVAGQARAGEVGEADAVGGSGDPRRVPEPA